ncbi:MAG: hypothetical protein ACOYD4_11745 [Solirubrobacterales bacterium]
MNEQTITPTVDFDHNLGQYVAEFRVGAHRFASLMGADAPTKYQLNEAERRMLRQYAAGRRTTTFVSPFEVTTESDVFADDELNNAFWEDAYGY